MLRVKMLSIAMILLLAGLMGSPGAAEAAGLRYEVTVTNITKNVLFTPLLIVTHKRGVKLFTLGDPASEQLENVAEIGNTVPFEELLDPNANPHVAALANTGAIPAGTSATVEIESKFGFNRVSLIGMLLPTNDGFVAVNGAKVPLLKKSVTIFAPGYDAGTEGNNEKCEDIPGPQCGGSGSIEGSPEGEGFVHIHSGIHGIGYGELPEETYDWHNPVAKITIRRIY